MIMRISDGRAGSGARCTVFGNFFPGPSEICYGPRNSSVTAVLFSRRFKIAFDTAGSDRLKYKHLAQVVSRHATHTGVLCKCSFVSGPHFPHWAMAGLEPLKDRDVSRE